MISDLDELQLILQEEVPRIIQTLSALVVPSGSTSSPTLVAPRKYAKMCVCASRGKACKAPPKSHKLQKGSRSGPLPFYHLPSRTILYYTNFGTKVPKLVPSRTEECTTPSYGGTD
jgi:hypothetical protein